jgi:hypothetical protein
MSAGAITLLMAKRANHGSHESPGAAKPQQGGRFRWEVRNRPRITPMARMGWRMGQTEETTKHTKGTKRIPIGIFSAQPLSFFRVFRVFRG